MRFVVNINYKANVPLIIIQIANVRSELWRYISLNKIEIVEAQVHNSEDVSELVKSLLIELEPSVNKELEASSLYKVTKDLLSSSKIIAFLARMDERFIGVITLHECAAIYAGGVFGEISELYVEPEFRALNVGELLLNSAIEKGKSLHWRRIEVGSPPPSESPRTIRFYENKGFICTGLRLKRQF